MALTMTRTRTQTTLTRLAELLANLNGELEFVDTLLAEMPEHVEVLTRRREALGCDKAAVQLTLSQFDPSVVGASISATQEWCRPFGGIRARQAGKKYVEALFKFVKSEDR